MTTTTLAARDEVMRVVNRALSSRPDLVVRYQGLDTQSSPDPNTDWIHVEMKHADGVQASLVGPEGEGSRWRQFGTIAVQCFARAAVGGMRDAITVACVIRDAFRGKSTPGGVWFRGHTIREIGPHKSWFQVNVSVLFEYDEIMNRTLPPPINLIYDFPTPSLQWVVNHNLGRRVTVEAYTPGGVQVWATVTHTTVDQTVVSFDLPQAGYALVDY
ncbi:MAG: hypothetical protein DDT26_00029 [Dehalococcoidia bacterium]|nr:hypothetical protein [Chloroflexota bacterium]